MINRTQNVTMTSADNLVVFGTIETGANAFLRAFNDVDLRASSIITAVNQILVTGDDGATNAVGSTVTVGGKLTASRIDFLGGADSDRLVVPNQVLEGRTETVWNITGNNSGNIDNVYGFSLFEGLEGGVQNDRFVYREAFANSGLTSGGGGSGIDTLDYSGFSAATVVNVNLTTGVRNGGTVSNIERVIGGAANDSLVGDAFANWLIGGPGNDTIVGNGNDDILVGDTADIDLNGNALVEVSTLTDFSGNDTISSGAAGLGFTLILGGSGLDTLNAGTGRAIVVGDHGKLLFTNGILSSFESTNSTVGAVDTITVQGGVQNIVIGGAGADSITATNGTNLLIGDDASITVNGLAVAGATSASSASAAGDTITGGLGSDWVIGGAGVDTINAGAGNDIVLGDYGVLTLTNGLPSSVATTEPAVGGNDVITLGADSDVALGGFGSDTFTDAGGQNAIVGDEGIVTFAGRLISRIESVGNTGAADTFTGATGDDLVIGGAGGDTINAGAGNNVAIGDFGVISLNGGIVVSVEATEPNEGAADNLSGTTGNDVFLGGPNNDTISGGDGRNILLGDRGVVTLGNGIIRRIETTASLSSGSDGITGVWLKTSFSAVRETTRFPAAVAVM